jgi:transposase-like protein
VARRRDYVKVVGRWRSLYRAVDQYGQVIDVLLTEQRDTAAARRSFVHVTEQYADNANNAVEADHGRPKARLRPMRGLKRFRSAAVITAGHAFVQNLRRGHYQLATDVPPLQRLTAAFAELARAI